MKTIGLIGGMSWESTVTYYQIVNRLVQERLGGFHSAKCILHSVDFHEIEACQRAGDWERSGELLAEAARGLERAGADCVLICTNTMHKVADAVQAEYQAYYEKHTQVKTQPYDGIPELLHALAERGLKLAVLSNKPDADTKNVISHFFPDVPFSVVRGQVEGVPVKPDKAGALLVAEQLGIAPADFLYLGDTKVDMTCACSAGMNPVGVLWGFRTAQELLDNGAKVLIAHPMELLEKFNL